MNGDSVNIDPQLNKTILDKDLKPKPVEEMTPEERQVYDFQQWWQENGSDIEKLFGIGGKYEKTTINFKLGTMPYAKRSLSNLFGLFRRNKSTWDGYDALTTFGSRGSDPGTFFRGGDPVGPLNMSVNDLVFNIWFNPNRHMLPQNTAEHEWNNHVGLIFDCVKNNLVIPTGTAQHLLPITEIK